MFFSTDLLARKTLLGKVWLAGTAKSTRQLSKRMVEEMDLLDLAKSVKEPVVKLALRAEGILLLGLAVIYEKKCASLLLESNEARQALIALVRLRHRASASRNPVLAAGGRLDDMLSFLKDVDLPAGKQRARPETITMQRMLQEATGMESAGSRQHGLTSSNVFLQFWAPMLSVLNDFGPAAPHELLLQDGRAAELVSMIDMQAVEAAGAMSALAAGQHGLVFAGGSGAGHDVSSDRDRSEYIDFEAVQPLGIGDELSNISATTVDTTKHPRDRMALSSDGSRSLLLRSDLPLFEEGEDLLNVSGLIGTLDLEAPGDGNIDDGAGFGDGGGFGGGDYPILQLEDGAAFGVDPTAHPSMPTALLKKRSRNFDAGLKMDEEDLLELPNDQIRAWLSSTATIVAAYPAACPLPSPLSKKKRVKKSSAGADAASSVFSAAMAPVGVSWGMAAEVASFFQHQAEQIHRRLAGSRERNGAAHRQTEGEPPGTPIRPQATEVLRENFADGEEGFGGGDGFGDWQHPVDEGDEELARIGLPAGGSSRGRNRELRTATASSMSSDDPEMLRAVFTDASKSGARSQRDGDQSFLQFNPQEFLSSPARRRISSISHVSHSDGRNPSGGLASFMVSYLLSEEGDDGDDDTDSSGRGTDPRTPASRLRTGIGRSSADAALSASPSPSHSAFSAPSLVESLDSQFKDSAELARRHQTRIVATENGRRRLLKDKRGLDLPSQRFLAFVTAQFVNAAAERPPAARDNGDGDSSNSDDGGERSEDIVVPHHIGFFSDVTKGKTGRNLTVKCFYQMLVLQTAGFISSQQEQPFGEILIGLL